MGDTLYKMKQFLIGLDQWINTWFGGMADETISARAYRSDWQSTMKVINWLFRDPNHCKNSYYSEVFRSQLPSEYKED